MRFLFITIIALGFVSCNKEVIKPNTFPQVTEPNTFPPSDVVTKSDSVTGSSDVVTIKLYTSAPVNGEVALYRYNDIEADTIVDLSTITTTTTNIGDHNYFTYIINVNYSRQTVVGSLGRFYVEASFDNAVNAININTYNGSMTFNGNELLPEPANVYKENTTILTNSFFAKYKKDVVTDYESNDPTM